MPTMKTIAKITNFEFLHGIDIGKAAPLKRGDALYRAEIRDLGGTPFLAMPIGVTPSSPSAIAVQPIMRYVPLAHVLWFDVETSS